MVPLSFLCSLSCILLIFPSFSTAYERDCKWRSNISDIEDVAHHKYQVLEECLFYKLTKDADAMQGKSNALMLLPPTIAAKQTLDVQILHTAVRSMWMNEVFKEMNIQGYIKMAWQDRRLRWDITDWKTDTLNIKNYGRLWMPDINSDKGRMQDEFFHYNSGAAVSLFHTSTQFFSHQTASQSADYLQYQDIQSNNNGNLTARLEFRIQAQCEIDYTDFPSDVKHCCFNLQSTLYKRYIKFYLENEDDHLDLSQLKSNWHIDYSSIVKTEQDDDNKADRLSICMDIRRKSTTLALELALPCVISALLLIIAPFFGKFKQQIQVKMFALLLQLMSFQFMADKAPQVGFGETVPKIYMFYAFTLGTTVISLILTVMIAAMSRVKRAVPPASVLNANLCCGSEEDPITDGTSTKDASSDWLQIHSALNNMVSFLTLFIYIVGSLVIAF